MPTIRRVFAIADLHLGHRKLVEGWDDSGRGPRYGAHGATTVEEHDEMIISRWNDVVREQDKVYVLGDVAFGKGSLDKLKLLNGHTQLVGGNHDALDVEEYAKHFEKVLGAKIVKPGLLLTHIPVHPSSFNRRSMQVNVHGHTHEHVVKTMRTLGPGPTDVTYTDEADPRYVCVSCEQVDYQPIDLDAIRAQTAPLIKD